MNRQCLRILIIGVNHFIFIMTMGIKDRDSTLNLAKCIVEAVHSVSERKIALDFDHSHYNLVTEILKIVNRPVVLNAVEIPKFAGLELRFFNNFVLAFREEPRDILKETLWDRDTRFLLITTELEKMKKYFEYFWTFKVINVFAILTNGNGTLVYSFLPFIKQNCKALEVLLVDSCIDGKLIKKALAIQDKMRIKNMNGCSVNITVSDSKPNVIFEPDKGRNTTSSIKGFEGNLIAEVAKVYNFNSTYKLPDDGIGWGWIRPTPRGTISEVYLGKSEIAIGMLGPLPERFEYLDLAASYNIDECLTFAVPRGYAVKKSLWKTIFLIEFTTMTWSLIIFSFTLISISMWVINGLLNLNWFSSKTESVFMLFSSCLGLPIKTPNYTSAKTLIAFWITFVFITSVAYKGSMGSKLTVPSHDPDLQTLSDLVQSDLRLTGYKIMFQTIKHVDDQVYKKISKRYNFENYTVEYVINRIANRDKLANLRHTSTFHYYATINPKARGKIHTLRECVYTYHPVAITKKYSPFTNKIHQVNNRLEESGIMTMWRAKYLQTIPHSPKKFFKLSIHQMIGIFYVLLLGYVISLLCFLLEISVNLFYPKIFQKIKNFNRFRVIVIDGKRKRNKNNTKKSVFGNEKAEEKKQE